MDAVAVRNPECPICGETFQDGRGLSGHLQFKHDLSGDDHRRKLDKGMDRGRRDSKAAQPEHGGRAGRSVRDRELELKGMLWEIQVERQQVQKEMPGAFDLLQTEKREELKEELNKLDEREEEIREQLAEIDRDSDSEIRDAVKGVDVQDG